MTRVSTNEDGFALTGAGVRDLPVVPAWGEFGVRPRRFAERVEGRKVRGEGRASPAATSSDPLVSFFISTPPINGRKTGRGKPCGYIVRITAGGGCATLQVNGGDCSTVRGEGQGGRIKDKR
jgi:hypothetical protein